MRHIPLLQSSTFYQTQTDWRTILMMGGVSIAVILFLVIFNRLSTKRNQRGGHHRYSKRMFRREANSLGLSREQIHLLEHCIKMFKIKQPFRLLVKSSLLINTMRRAIRQLDNTREKESVIEARKLELYRILQKVDISGHVLASKQTTKMLKPGEKVLLTLKEETEVQTVVTSNIQDFYCIRSPISTGHHNANALRKGSKISLSIFDSRHNMKITFESKILGFTDIKEGNHVMLKHSICKKASEPRKGHRRSLSCACNFNPVNLVEQKHKHKKTSRAINVSKQRISGTLINISHGGCTAESLESMPIGGLVKMTFSLPTTGRVEVLGKIVNSQKNARRRSVSNIFFTRASTKNLNKINGYVFESV